MNYTEDQASLVRLINSDSLTDCYSILGVDEKRSSPEEIRKAYKKLCLKVHPDKNKAPSADEAFKKVDDAYHHLLLLHTSHPPQQSSDSDLNPRPRPRAAGKVYPMNMKFILLIGGFACALRLFVIFMGDYPVPKWPGSSEMVPLHSTSVFNLIGVAALKTVQLVTPGIEKSSTAMVRAASSGSGKIIMLSAVGVVASIFMWCL